MAIRRVTSGACRHLFAIKKNALESTDLDSLGREQISSTTYATVKCEVRKLTGQERLQAHQEFGTGTHEAMLWYVPGVTTKMWLEGLNGKRFNIVDVDNVEERDYQLRLLLQSETS